MTDWKAVAEAGLALRGVEPGTTCRQPALKLGGRVMACAGKADDHFVLMLDPERVAVLVEMEPELFFQTPHYVGHPCVLVRYAALPAGELAALLAEAWHRRAPAAWRAAGP